MGKFLRLRVLAFRYAFAGWWYVLRTQRNAWIHASVSIIVFVMAAWLSLPARDWALLILTIAMVWITEFANTALEAVVDLASPEIHPLAKIGKDVAAAAVLIAAMASVMIGLLIMGPPLIDKLQKMLISGKL